MKTVERVLAKSITPGDMSLVISFAGAEPRVEIPWEKCSARLAAASPTERKTCELSPGGYGVHWPMLDEDLSIAGLLRSVSQH